MDAMQNRAIVFLQKSDEQNIPNLTLYISFSALREIGNYIQIRKKINKID